MYEESRKLIEEKNERIAALETDKAALTALLAEKEALIARALPEDHGEVRQEVTWHRKGMEHQDERKVPRTIPTWILQSFPRGTRKSSSTTSMN